MDRFSFEFELAEYGWARLRLGFLRPASICELQVSYVSDALGDITRSAAELLCRGELSSVTYLHQELSSIRCSMLRPPTSHVTIELESDQWYARVSCPSSELGRAILQGVGSIDVRRYADEWPYDLPLGAIGELRAAFS